MVELMLLADGEGIAGLFVGLIYLAIIVLMIVGGWKMFEKANQPGWGVIIPIYNAVLVLRIAGRPVWWLILMFIPIVSLIVGIMVCIDLAKNFGKSGMFAVGLVFLPFVFVPILGFGDAEYNPVRVPAA